MTPLRQEASRGRPRLRAIAAVLVVALLWLGAAGAAFAQASVAMWCWNPTGSSATNNQYQPCNAANPLVVSATISPSGTQNVNLTQILGSAVSASNPLPVVVESGGSTPGAGSQPYNYTAVTGAQYGLPISASTALTVPATALQAVVCARGNNVNYTYDGTTTPTALIGMPLYASSTTGQCIQFSGATVLANLRFIQTAATATIDVSYTK